MSPSDTWESFSTFLDQQQQPAQPAPGQMPDWSQNFQLGQRPDYSNLIGFGQDILPGAPMQPQQPGLPSNFNPNAPSPYQQPANPNSSQYANQRIGGVTAPTQAADPAGGLFSSLGQSQRHTERRENNRGGAYGSARRDQNGAWSFNIR